MLRKAGGATETYGAAAAGGAQMGRECSVSTPGSPPKDLNTVWTGERVRCAAVCACTGTQRSYDVCDVVSGGHLLR